MKIDFYEALNALHGKLKDSHFGTNVYNGVAAAIKLIENAKTCPACLGSGIIKEPHKDPETCSECEGVGFKFGNDSNQDNRKINKYHWYSIRYKYKKDDKQLAEWVVDIGFKNRNDILSLRKRNKVIPSLHKYRNGIFKKVLCNGSLFNEPICYLDYMENHNHNEK